MQLLVSFHVRQDFNRFYIGNKRRKLFPPRLQNRRTRNLFVAINAITEFQRLE
jgi:hypothetical protein